MSRRSCNTGSIMTRPSFPLPTHREPQLQSHNFNYRPQHIFNNFTRQKLPLSSSGWSENWSFVCGFFLHNLQFVLTMEPPRTAHTAIIFYLHFSHSELYTNINLFAKTKRCFCLIKKISFANSRQLALQSQL